MKIGYKAIKDNDAIRDLTGFPTEIIKAMLREQLIQGNASDVKVFQSFKSRDAWHGGFDWNATSQGFDFWERVVGKEDFAYFFKKYKP